MTGPQLYRHRPTVVHAVHYTPFTIATTKAFLAERWPGRYQFSEDGNHLLLETPEGDRDCLAEDGYWIIEGVVHEPYCVGHDVFTRVYEPAIGAADDAHAPPGIAMCGAGCSHGGTCTAPAGHTGDHATYARDGVAYCTWPQGAQS